MKNLIFCTAILLLVSCGGGQKKAAAQTQGERVIPEFDLSEPSRAAIGEKLTWNDLAKNIRVIPLETNDASLLAHTRLMAVTDNYYVLHSMPPPQETNGIAIYTVRRDNSETNVFVFGRDGDFVLHMNRYGRGGSTAMEYLTVSSASLTEDPFTLKIADAALKIRLSYDKTGKGVAFDSIPNWRGNINMVDDDHFISIYSHMPTHQRELVVLGSYDKATPHRDLISFSGPIQTIFTERESDIGYATAKHGNGLLVYLNTSDTVYMVTRDGLEEFARIKRGGYSLDKSIYAVEPNSDRDSRKRSVIVNRFIPLGDKYFISYELGDTYYTEIREAGGKRPLYRKSYDRSTNMLRAKGMSVKLPDGALFPLSYRPYYSDNNKLYFLVNAFDIMEYMPEIKEDDNPVLIEMEF